MQRGKNVYFPLRLAIMNLGGTVLDGPWATLSLCFNLFTQTLI